jgi:hypothetical protein
MYVIVKLDCYGNEPFSGGTPDEVYGPYETRDDAYNARNVLPEGFAVEYRIVEFIGVK